MTIRTLPVLALSVAWLGASAALAQQPSATAESGGPAAAINEMPDACRKAVQDHPMAERMRSMPMMQGMGQTMPMQDMPTMQGGPGGAGLSEASRAYMAAMRKMNPPMMMGALASDPELGFLCAMLAHHQGAVDMARAALDRTKSEAVREIVKETIEENEKGMKEIRAELDKRAR